MTLIAPLGFSAVSQIRDTFISIQQNPHQLLLCGILGVPELAIYLDAYSDAKLSSVYGALTSLRHCSYSLVVVLEYCT